VFFAPLLFFFFRILIADLDSSVLRLVVNRTNRDRSPLTEDLIGDRAKCFFNEGNTEEEKPKYYRTHLVHVFLFLFFLEVTIFLFSLKGIAPVELGRI
jgi:hypothetical protein